MRPLSGRPHRRLAEFTVPSPADPLEWWVGGLVLLGYAVLLVLLGHLLSWRRDVT